MLLGKNIVGAPPNVVAPHEDIWFELVRSDLQHTTGRSQSLACLACEAWAWHGMSLTALMLDFFPLLL